MEFPISDEIEDAVSRYRSYGWEGDIIYRLINRRFGTDYTIDELQRWWDKWQNK